MDDSGVVWLLWQPSPSLELVLSYSLSMDRFFGGELTPTNPNICNENCEGEHLRTSAFCSLFFLDVKTSILWDELQTFPVWLSILDFNLTTCSWLIAFFWRHAILSSCSWLIYIYIYTYIHIYVYKSVYIYNMYTYTHGYRSKLGTLKIGWLILNAYYNLLSHGA